MKITVYHDVLSLWCLYADRSLDGVLSRHGGRLEFDWKISLIKGRRPLGYPPGMGAFYYDRGAALTTQRLNPDWYASGAGTFDANLVAEAARSLGVADRQVYRSLMDAAMVEGKPVHRRDVAVSVAARAAGLDPGALAAAARTAAIRERILATTEEMLSLGVDQRPVIVFENAIPDRAILSGVWAYEPLAALCDAMLRDELNFLAFNRNHPEPAGHKAKKPT